MPLDDRPHDPPHRADFDRPGALSIVVQGPLFQGNLVETANHCRHWRELFPGAQIILSVSVTDIVVGAVEGEVFAGMHLVPRHHHDGHLHAAVQGITASCDLVVLARCALPLPPIKSDSPKLNNTNMLIAAAQGGLALANGTYVLRIRSDMVFLDRGFLDQWAAGQAMPRQDAAVFGQRVLISWLYTLNPFTVERMALHFSDWFHFGRTEDVRQVWDVPEITLQDAMHYRAHPHAPGSNAAERLFNIRRAVEQHILYHCFKRHLPGLVLDHHTDRTSEQLALDILVDNFVLCDLVAARCVFEKYAGEFLNPDKRTHCLTPEDWYSLARHRGASYAALLSHGTDSGWDQPRTIPAAALRPKESRLLNGEIVGTGQDGVLFFGPYVTVPPGQYVAMLDITTLDGEGTLTLSVTAEAGKRFIGNARVKVGSGAPPHAEVAFDVVGVPASGLEVVCDAVGLREIAVSGLTVRPRVDAAAEMPAKWSLRRIGSLSRAGAPVAAARRGG